MTAPPDLVERWRLIGAATRDQVLTAADVAVLWSILDRMGEDGKAFPGFGRLSKDTGFHRATIARSIPRLVARGFVDKDTGEQGRSNRYRIPTGRTNATSSDDATSRKEASISSSANATDGSRMDATLINFIEPTSLNQRKARTTRVQKNRVEIPDWMPTELWAEWRKHRGSKLKPVAENNAFRKLDALRTEGHDPTKIVRRSLEHGWAGLYADERGTETRADGTRPAFKPVGLIQRDTRTEEEIDADLREQMARFGMNPEILDHEVIP